MNEEEKKAIDIVENIKFKTYSIYLAKEMKNEIRFYQTEEERKAIDIVLNLIKKWQKEIEEYKAKLENERNNCRKFYQEYNKFINDEYKEKIIEQQKEIEELKLDLEEMVKSNNHKLENWVHKNVLNSYISKDKIRKKLNYFEHSFDYDDDGTSYELVIEVLDELLEEN